MAFVPGFDHDVFISYAHGDDRDWINRFLDRLKASVTRLLPGATIWIDQDSLRKSRNFEQDIPEELQESAALISLVSPIYITRPYCVNQECRRFGDLVAARKQAGQRFGSPEFASELFGFRCPILPMPDQSYRSTLIPGATDISFCDDIETYAIGRASFEEQLRVLLRELVALLRRMRNRSTPVFVYPRLPPAELEEVHSVLTRELNAQSYRVLPENELDPKPHVGRCELAVLLLGARYDGNSRGLVDAARDFEKPLVVWPSPALARSGALEQRGFLEYVRSLEFGRKTLLDPAVTPEKLKQEVIALLDPRSRLPSAPGSKPRVYLIYDFRKNGEQDNAGKIAFHYQDEFYFEHSDEPRHHIAGLTQSEGVLLVWGEADEQWCAGEFEQMARLSYQPKSRGLCLFHPKESKVALANQIRTQYAEIHVAEEFGPFDPSCLEPFFDPIRRAQAGTA